MSKVKNHSSISDISLSTVNWEKSPTSEATSATTWISLVKKLKKIMNQNYLNTIDSPSSFQVVLRIWRPLPSQWLRGSRLQKSKPLPAEQSSLWGFGCLFSDLLLQITWKRSAFHPNLEKSNVCRKRYKCRLGSDFLFSYFLLSAQVGSPMQLQLQWFSRVSKWSCGIFKWHRCVVKVFPWA